MLRYFFASFSTIHVFLIAALAAGLFRFWARTRFWLPIYIHVLAAVAFVVSLWTLSNAPPDAPVDRDGPVVRVLISLALPAIVYAIFILHGGQRAAFTRAFLRKVVCPYCQTLVWIRNGASDTRSGFSRCTQCGQTFKSP